MIHDMKEAGAISPLAGKPAPASLLVALARLERDSYKPEMNDPTQVVSFGTSGHRGSPFRGSFTEAHIAAITQAICDIQREGDVTPTSVISWAILVYNRTPIGGLKIVTAGGWFFAARPSGTEDIYKIYAESFRGAPHLDALVAEAQDLVDAAVGDRP